MRFIGNIYEERFNAPGETPAPPAVIRGSIEVLGGGNEGHSRRRYFGSLDEMKKIVEVEYAKERALINEGEVS